MSIDRAGARAAVEAFLRALGHDPNAHPDLAETPARVVDAYADELLAGYQVDIGALIRSGSVEVGDSPPSGPVTVRDLAVATVCPHHLTPALGRATVCYLPGPRVLGLGTIGHLVDACARRLVLQEQLGQDVVDALIQHAAARGAACELELRHACLCARGARQAGASVYTLATAGLLAQPDHAPLLARLLAR